MRNPSDAQALSVLVARHPVRLARLMGYDRLVEPMHDGWIRSILLGTGDMTLLAHRGSYKTTCLEVALWLFCLLYPERTCGFLRKTADDVAEVMSAVSRMLESDVSAEVSRVIYGREAVVSSSSTDVTTDMACNVSGSPQIAGFGINGSLTGKHYDLICTDDIVTLRDRVSRAERERTKGVYRELQNVRNRGGRIVNTGTPWHRDDAISTLMPEAERWPISRTGLVSPEQEAALRGSMTRSLFAANYELRHVQSEGVLFQGEPTTFADRSLLHDGYMQVDAAYGGSDGTAVTCVAWHGDVPYVHGELWPETHVDRRLERIRYLHDELRLGTVHMERNADKGYLAEKLRDMGLPVSTYQEHENKFVKISTHARGVWSRLERLESDGQASADYWDEVMDYTEGAEHDDAPDSLASAVRLHGSGVHANILMGGI